MTRVRHLFWDFDGTLYNSYPQIVQAMRRALGGLGLEGLPPEGELLSLLKVSVYRAACRFSDILGLPAERIMTAFHACHDQETNFPPYAGLAECLSDLHAAGFRHYLYPHRNLAAVRQLQRDGLYRYFTDAVTRVDGFADKPAPDALRALTARNGVAPETAAMIGDRAIDIEAGHNAGMAGILFDPDGFYPDLQAEMRVRSMAELRALLLKEAPRQGGARRG